MVFSSPIFLFLFLPICLSFYFLIPSKFKNLFLLLFSLFFYTWGERKYPLVIIISIIVNFVFVHSIERLYAKPTTRNKIIRSYVFVVALLFNIGMLLLFKYTNFFVNNINILSSFLHLGIISIPTVKLPLGISFFTFHALSYLVDIYRKQVKSHKKIVDSSLYMLFFPQLVAGPIIRYKDILSQIHKRTVATKDISIGISRFIIGLGKKVLIANSLATLSDVLFNINSQNITTDLAWLGVIAYTLQIYFDFSGYSDMAIGLARMFGFTFMENFNYPYISQSITDFWRRWHISLSNWFKEYVYIPLGGNRRGANRTYLNLFIVFFLCGFWHGASWNFIVWGLWYALFLILEKWRLLAYLKRIWQPLRHLYTLLIVMIGWVFFRSTTLLFAFNYLKAMFSWRFGSVQTIHSAQYYLNSEIILFICIGILASIPFKSLINSCRLAKRNIFNPDVSKIGYYISQSVYVFFLAAILFFSSLAIAGNTYNPFIYFRF